MPITVKASASGVLNLAGVWVAAIRGGVFGLPAYVDAKVDLGWNAEAKFTGWNPTAGKWTLLYGAVPGPTGATTILATKMVTVTVEDATFRIAGVAPPNAKVTITGPSNVTASANSAGGFLVEGLKAGSYTVSTSKPSCTITPASQKVTLGPSVTDLSFKGDCRYSVSGIVKGAGAGATVTAGSRSTTTDKNEAFTLTQVPEGPQTLKAAKSGCEIAPPSMLLSVSGDITGRTFTAKCSTPPPPALYSISGNVGVSGVTVSAAGRAVPSDAKGNYTINNVPAGTHKLTALKPGCSWSPVSLMVTVGPKSATGQNLKPTCK